MTLRSPTIVLSVGSFGNRVVRCIHHTLQRSFGKTPDFVCFRSLDTTEQGSGPPALPQQAFLNFGRPRTTVTLERIADYPDLHWYPEDGKESLKSGRGAGGQAYNARLMLRDSIHSVSEFLTSALRSFSPAELPAVAARCNKNPKLLEMETQIATSGGVDVYVVGTTLGGSSGAILDILALLHRQARDNDILSLNVMPFLVGPTDRPDASNTAQRKYVGTYRALNEFLRSFQDPDYYWLADNVEIQFHGPLAPTLYVVEPGTPRLPKIESKMADMISDLVLQPVGKALGDLIVDDQMSVLSQYGSHAQQKVFSTISHATLFAVPPKAVEFTGTYVLTRYLAHELAHEVAGNGSTGEFPALLSKSDSELITVDSFERLVPKLKERKMPVNATSATASRFLDRIDKQMQAEADELLAEAYDSAARQTARVGDAAFQRFSQLLQDCTVADLTCVVEDLIRRVETVRQATDMQTSIPSPAADNQPPLAERKAAHETSLQQKFFMRVDEELAGLQNRLDRLRQTLRLALHAFQQTVNKRRNQLQRLQAESMPDHIVLDYGELAAFLDGKLDIHPLRRIRNEAFQQAGTTLSAERLVERLTAASEPIGEQAISELQDINRTFEIVGPLRTEQLVEGVWRDAGSATRIDPTYSPAEYQQHTISNVADGSLSAEVLRRQEGDLTLAPSTSPDQLMVTRVVHGLEPTVLTLTHEARKAVHDYTLDPARKAKFPWSRKGFEPAHLVAPGRSDFYKCLTLPVAQVFELKHFYRDESQGWVYRNGSQEVVLGDTTSQAFRTLFGQQPTRPPKLPSASDISHDTERYLRDLSGNTARGLVRTFELLLGQLKKMQSSKALVRDRMLIDDAVYACESLLRQTRDNVLRFESEQSFRINEGEHPDD